LKIIGCGNAFGGTNEDEEEAGGSGGSGDGVPAEKVLDIQFNFNLVEYPMSKADFMTYIKGYLKKVKEYLSENKSNRVEPFMKGAQEFIKTVVSKFEEYTL